MSYFMNSGLRIGTIVFNSNIFPIRSLPIYTYVGIWMCLFYFSQFIRIAYIICVSYIFQIFACCVFCPYCYIKLNGIFCPVFICICISRLFIPE